MHRSIGLGLSGEGGLQELWRDGGRVFCRGWRVGDDGKQRPVLAVLLAGEHPSPSILDRLAHEYALKDELDGAWALPPLEFVHEGVHSMLVLDDSCGEPLERRLGAPMEIETFLRIAIRIVVALGKAHQRGLVHKDIKPSNIIVSRDNAEVRLTGFGIASRLPRERQLLNPPETIAGTLAYMAPEQTGRMNRSIDSRSDLYSLGITLYQMLTGALPFAAADPMEWVHCHTARKPVPPMERLARVPAPVSHIVMRLLAKTPEDRYQTAKGVERDLQRCLGMWERARHIDDFPLCEYDTPDRLLIPEKLYGREREVETLVAAFDRIVQSGTPELVLVTGYSGIGKSSIVNELHKVLVPPRGLFASGKLDQYKRDIPYSTLVQAFQSLVRPLLGKREPELASWRSALLEALEPNARLMTELIPELKLIIGDPPPVPELEPQQAQSRFHLVFRRFIGVFARPEHPLALFLDDLQWIDAATLDLIEHLLARSDLQHLMLIGAYRDNEVDAAHPLMRKLNGIRLAGAQVREIRLTPLAQHDLAQLIADALLRAPQHAALEARLVHEKTGGNPFFMIQFLYSLADEGLLAFDHDAACWCWDLDRIHAKGYTNNVVDFMAGRLNRLPIETQEALQQFAALGNIAAMTTLSIVLESPEEQVHAILWPAVRQELVECLEGSYKFMHDRVQEAAYSLIPEASRADAHLRIGRLLAAHTPPDRRNETVFEIVNQLNRGAALIDQREEREQLAELNLIAAKRAKGSTAYSSALTYLNAGAALLLAEDSWVRRHELMFALELNRAECEFLIGQTSVAEERLAALSKRATTTVEQATVACVHMDVCTALDQSGRAVTVCLDYLRQVGIEWSPHPQEDEVRREYERIWSLLGERTIEDLIDLPPMDDPASLGTVEVLSKVLPPAWFADANLACLTSCKAVSLSIERGNCDASCVAYLLLGRIAGRRFGDYKAGFRFGQLGFELVERRGLKRFEASAYHFYAIFVVPWMKHVRGCRDLLQHAFKAANRIGDLTYGAYACHNLNSDLLFAGEPLPDLQGEVEHGLAFVEKMQFGRIIDIITTQLALVRMLRGLTPTFGCLDDGQYDEVSIESRFSDNPHLAIAACWYWIRKLQARYIAGDVAMAIDAASKARQLLWISSSHFEEAEYHFFGALVQAAYCDCVPAGERSQHLDAVAAHHRQLQVWAENCAENFENRVALVGAELARIEGRVLDAEHLYEQAVRSARDNGFVQNEALANELASRFYRSRGFGRIADLYLRDARYAYLRWGADGKVRQLDAMYPHLRREEAAAIPTGTIAAPLEQLDLATVIKVSQAISGEMVLEKLIDTLMRTAIAQAGAARGLLILSHAAEPRTAAEATTSSNGILVESRDAPVTAADLPESILNYVLRTRDSIILDDAATQSSFATDPYIRQRQARSLVCLPLINQAKLIGALYLENNLAPRAFAPSRVAVLKLLASQAAISLENARLYRGLTQREATIRRLVKTAHRSEMELRDVIETIPVMAWTALPDGSNTFMNRRWAEYTGLSAQDTAGSGWQVAVHPEEVEQYLRKWRASLTTGEPFEGEARFRCAADGEYRWFLGRAVPLRDNQGNILRWYGILTDIEDRKRAEALLAGEKRILEMVAKGDSLARILDSLCVLVEEHAQDAFASILLVEDGRLRHVGKPSLPQAYVEAIEGIISVQPKVGSCGPAAYFAKQVIVSDIMSDPLFDELRDIALPLFPSLRAVWSTPIVSSEGRVIGTFAMYYREPRSPSPHDQEIIEQVTHLAGVAIQRFHLDRDLAEREAKIRRLVDANIIGIFIWNFDGRILEANDSFLRMIGYDREDLASGRLRWADLMPPEWLDCAARECLPELRTVGSVQPYEKEYFRKDGSRVPILIGAATFEEGGNEGVAFVLDLTERKRAEEAVRESEERFRTLVQFSFDVYWESDEQHRFIRQEFAEGVADAPAPGSELGKTRWEVPYLEPDAEAWRKHRETLDAHLPFRDFELARPTPDGGKRYVSVSGLPVFDEAGRFVGYRGVGRHITERKRVEQELRASEELKRRIIESSRDCIKVLDLDGNLLFMSSGGQQLLEIDNLQVYLNSCWIDFWQPEDRHRISEAVAAARAGGIGTFQAFCPSAKGSPRWWDVVITPICNAEGQPEQLLAVSRDVTERERAEAEARERDQQHREMQMELAHANRVATMGQLTASIAHEVKQPIAATMANAQAALRFLGGPMMDLDEVRQILHDIVRDGNRAGEVISRIRDLVKKAPPRRDRWAINGAIREVIELIRAEAVKNGVSVYTELADGLPLVHGDRVQLQQVLLNLNINAIEAMSGLGEGPRELLVGTGPTDSGGVLVTVRDSGPGLAPATLDRVFESFYTTKPSGLGLGLSICRSIIEAHGGRLWASENLPRGAIFQFTVPAEGT